MGRGLIRPSTRSPYFFADLRSTPMSSISASVVYCRRSSAHALYAIMDRAYDQLITRDDPAVIDHLVDHCCIVENRGFFMH